MNSINIIDKKKIPRKSITKLADEARTFLNHNKYLLEMIEIFNHQITTVKNLIINYSLNSNKSTERNNLALEYKNKLSSLNSRLKEEIKKIKKKQGNILNNITQDLFEINQSFSSFSVDNFILTNTINKLNSQIINLNKGVESSKKYDLFREPERESELELKESKSYFLVYNLENQQKMLSYCRSYTNYKYKNNKKSALIEKYNDKISILKKGIKYYNTILYGDENKKKNKIPKRKKKRNTTIKNSVNMTQRKESLRLSQIPRSKDMAEDGEEPKLCKEDHIINKRKKCLLNRASSLTDKESKLLEDIKNEKNEKEKEKDENPQERKKINILNIDELLDIDNIEVEDEEIIETELNSDDEVQFEKKIKSKKKISVDCLNNIKTTIPSINLSQIEFNKLKVINEADAYSFQKRKFEQGNINGKIKSLRKQIKYLEKQIDMNQRKLNAIHNFIEDVKYNYKLLRPIKVQTSAAGNPVHYIREKLLNIVEETINESEQKQKMYSDNKYKTGKTAVEEGEDGEEEVGSDYSDEDKYMDNLDNKDNKNSTNDRDGDTLSLEKNKKNKNKEKNNEIKTNLISKFNYNENEDKENKNNNNQIQLDNYDNFENNILGNMNALSK